MKKNNSDEMKLALVTHGPIASSVNADTKTFRFYSHGIYDDPKCGKKIYCCLVKTKTFIVLMNGSVLDS